MRHKLYLIGWYQPPNLMLKHGINITHLKSSKNEARLMLSARGHILCGDTHVQLSEK